MTSIHLADRVNRNAQRRAHMARAKTQPSVIHDGRRPRSCPPQPTPPGGRPRQPGWPLTNQSCLVRPDTVVQPSTSPAAAPEGQWLFADRVLLAIMLSFSVAVVLGAIVIVNQYLALGTTP